MKPQQLSDHLDSQLGHDSGIFSPFRVHYFRPLPDDIYRRAMLHLPHKDLYRDLPHEDAMRPDGTSTRRVLDLNRFAPSFWGELGEALCSREVADTFRWHVGFEGPVRPIARLLRDYAGYRIAPHPDSSKKACTVQFYLPRDESQHELGTTFYTRDDDGVFTAAHRFGFLPNTGYCFRVTDSSWHGTNFGLFAKPRDTLILTYYKE